MKLLHTADLHLGKIVSGVSMLEDQRYILNEITKIIKHEEVDGIIIAGDLYDRSVPPTSAVSLLNDTLFHWNVELKLPIYAISGNHDSAERLNFGSAWYKNTQLFMAGKLMKTIEPISLAEAEIWLVPYHEPALVRELMQDDEIRSYEDAMQAITKQIRSVWDSSKAQILVGHAFVAGGIPSDSERQLSVGNVDRVSTTAFDGFDYVALGHLHHPHAISHPTIYYSGSPLKYSFSESQDQKSVRIVSFSGNKLTEVREVPLIPQKDMRMESGTLQDLTTNLLDHPEDYLAIRLEDKGALIDPIGKLRPFYPNILHLERKKLEITTQNEDRFEELMKKDDIELFDQFFEHVRGESLTKKQVDLMTAIFNEVRKEEN
ncbi:exonuclease SbcCD subunit D [Listeria aquatica]|uniref:Nuclease SbcCD subunit D n=1 Tax=Listeria aquatica FSL S10-1188 TaxID=1265818 RepID=W7B4L1_9LIST|nr:exonuclease SbcCD subunit D [Listeria aquatica]EUJ17676.1 hypothetical protein MAQA_11706 [Listeria aquatica FSL S10-1188]